ncbi:hypothetical protein KL933_004839 [Ogataea haglerorum]|uniref:Uncharacterized protein n=1 Tax=Ogataea haglerorum TaxID=1937702 RepID=A0AAN6D2D3_9ASCO|nr:uncharacterized protein KL911_004421 [Ogataea haglerorum]KAG7724335.1 hypothetical protein KL933_004839 [Ogataea haglerorum]KAG7746147.1 hypothetical protein KL912_004708 [Ogataea haglerorum]KAG7751843.1 hypothetical protein KL911_004421 [Ogataea haglerorum]
MTSLKNLLESVSQEEQLQGQLLLVGGEAADHIRFLNAFGIRDVSITPYGFHFAEHADVHLSVHSFAGDYATVYQPVLDKLLSGSLVVYILDALELLKEELTQESIFKRVSASLKPWINACSKASRCSIQVHNVSRVDYNVKSIAMIDYLQQLLRLIMMDQNGSVLFFQDTDTPEDIVQLLKSSAELRIKDYDNVFVPSGSDSYGKIKLLNEDFDCEGTLQNWNRIEVVTKEVPANATPTKTEDLRQKYQDFLRQIHLAV